MKKATKKEMYRLLDIVVKHFSKDPKALRSISSDGFCSYFPPKNKPKSIGCAIGMFIPWGHKVRWEALEGVSVDTSILFDALPKDLKIYSKGFLHDLQHLHDDERYWEVKGLSEFGVDLVKIIKQKIKDSRYV
jgi:hypothetical protein